MTREELAAARRETAAIVLAGLLASNRGYPRAEAISMAVHYADELGDELIRIEQPLNQIPPLADNPEEKGAGRATPVDERPAGERTFANALCEIAVTVAIGIDAHADPNRVLEEIGKIVGQVADEARKARAR